jgi:hypothetical protein
VTWGREHRWGRCCTSATRGSSSSRRGRRSDRAGAWTGRPSGRWRASPNATGRWWSRPPMPRGSSPWAVSSIGGWTVMALSSPGSARPSGRPWSWRSPAPAGLRPPNGPCCGRPGSFSPTRRAIWPRTPCSSTARCAVSGRPSRRRPWTAIGSASPSWPPPPGARGPSNTRPRRTPSSPRSVIATWTWWWRRAASPGSWASAWRRSAACRRCTSPATARTPGVPPVRPRPRPGPSCCSRTPSPIPCPPTPAPSSRPCARPRRGCSSSPPA